MNNLESMVEFLRQSGASEELIESFKERFETPQVTQEESTDAPQPTTEVEEPSVETAVENEQVIEEINEIQELEDKLQDLTASYYANEMSSEEFTKEKDKLESQIAQAKKAEVDKMVAKNIEARVKELEDQLQDLTASYYANEMSSEEFTRRKDELEALIAEAKNSNNNTKVVEEINSRVKELEDELQDLTAAYYGNEMSSEEFTERKNKLEALIAEAKNSGVNEKVNEKPQAEETNEKSEEVETAAPEEETVELPQPAQTEVKEEQKQEEPKVDEAKVEEPTIEESIDEPMVESELDRTIPDKEDEEVKQNNSSKETNYSTKFPGINFDKTKTVSENARAVIAGRRVRNIAISATVGGVALLATLPMFGGAPLLAAAVVGAKVGGGLAAYNTLVDYGRKWAFDHKIKKFASKFDTQVVFDYENQTMHFAYLDENGKFKTIDSYNEMENRLITKLKDQHLSEEALAKELARESIVQKKYFKKITGLDINTISLSSELGQVYDDFGGIAKNRQIPKQMYDQSKRVLEESAKKFADVINKKETYNLTEEQTSLITKDAEKAKEMVNKVVEVSRLSRMIKSTTNKFGDIKDALVNNRVAKALFDKDEYQEPLEVEELDYDLNDERSEEEFVETQEPESVENTVENPAVEEANEAPATEETQQVEEPQEETPESFDDMLEEYDLMKESEELSNDEVIDNNETQAFNSDSVPMDRDDFEDYRKNIDEQIQWLQANNQAEQAENLRTQLEQVEEQMNYNQDQGQSRGM